MIRNKTIGTGIAALIAVSSMAICSLPILAQTPPTPPVAGNGMGRMRGMHHGERHPEIRAALRHLRMAENNLKKGSHDFSGHREKALDLTQQAIKECEAALKADRK